MTRLCATLNGYVILIISILNDKNNDFVSTRGIMNNGQRYFSNLVFGMYCK